MFFYRKILGFAEIPPSGAQQPAQQPDLGNDTSNSTADQPNTGSSGAVPMSSVQRSRTPTPSLEIKPSAALTPTIQEINQKSPNVTEPSTLPLVGHSQSPANNNSSIQTPKNENQGKGENFFPSPK